MNSKLQIISGKYRGKKLKLPDNARPTQNMARGALFNMLNEIIDLSGQLFVWDAFGGSGAFGLECLSRFNNPKVVFTDNSANSLNAIKSNVASVKESAIIENIDAISGISRFGADSDLVFVDPPYTDFGLGLVFVKKISKIAKTGAILIWEFESNQPEPKIDDNWVVLKDKTYGRARFLILQKK